MRARPLTALVLAAVAFALCACAEPQESSISSTVEPPTRTSWALRHRVLETKELHVVGASMSRFEESTTVRVGADVRQPEAQCWVTLSAAGWGGPSNKVGDKLPTQVHGRPGFRDGSGAEGGYLMWQLTDGTWFEVGCDGPEERRQIDAVAAAVRVTPSSIALPFGVHALPPSTAFSSVTRGQEDGLTRVTVEPVGTAGGGELQITYESAESRDGYPRREPSGRPITVHGRPALLDTTPRSPEVCVFVQSRHVCVSSVASDTGPEPDRSAEVPALLAIAESLTFARDLEDLSTWIPAERALG